jgi:hypothetical protein
LAAAIRQRRRTSRRRRRRRRRRRGRLNEKGETRRAILGKRMASCRLPSVLMHK